MPSTTAPRAQTIALIVAAAMFMQNLDSAIINTSLPRMALSFHVGPVDLSLGITAYMLASAAVSPLSGWLSDRFGARNVLTAAVLVFTVASLGCGLATSLPAFVLARLAQGSGGALMMPVGMGVILHHSTKAELMRVTAFTVWPALVAPILGPVLGGFITQAFSWRWNFLLNLPIGTLGALAVFFFVPKDAREAGRKLDITGFVLCSLALTCLIAGFQRSSAGGPERAAAFGLIVLGAAAGWFAVRHLQTASIPLLRLSPLKNPAFFYASLFPAFLFRTQFYAAPLLLPLLFQLGFGLSPAAAGSWVICYFAGNLGIKPATSWILKTFGFRNVTSVNGLVVGLSILACGFLTPETPKPLTILLLLAAGASRSMQLTCLTTLTFAEIKPAEKSAASTLASMLIQTWAAVGIAVAAFLLALFQTLHGAHRVGLAELHDAFWAVGTMGLAGGLIYRTMPADIGAEVSLHRRKEKAPALEGKGAK